jgi:DNA-binding NtrC family response regulator
MPVSYPGVRFFYQLNHKTTIGCTTATSLARSRQRSGRRGAAEILDIGERTLYRKLRDYGIAPEEMASIG